MQGIWANIFGAIVFDLRFKIDVIVMNIWSIVLGSGSGSPSTGRLWANCRSDLTRGRENPWEETAEERGRQPRVGKQATAIRGSSSEVDWPAESDSQHSDGWQLDERSGRPQRRTWQRPPALEDDGRGWQRLPVERSEIVNLTVVFFF